jgi:hypothetical protein
MSRRGFPRLFLQHTLTVQPYTGWNTWGPATTVRGMYQEHPYRRHTRTGVVYHVVSTFYCPLDTVCPDGSTLPLPDGRAGYAAYAVRREGGGRPLPVHLEIGIDLGDTRSSPAAETVVLLRRTVSGRDAYGSDVYATTEVSVAGCSVLDLRPVESGPKSTTRVVTTGRVIMPPGTVVTAVDRLRVRGLVYDIDGQGVEQDDPMHPTDGPVEVNIRRTTG